MILVQHWFYFLPSSLRIQVNLLPRLSKFFDFKIFWFWQLVPQNLLFFIFPLSYLQYFLFIHFKVEFQFGSSSSSDGFFPYFFYLPHRFSSIFQFDDSSEDDWLLFYFWLDCYELSSIFLYFYFLQVSHHGLHLYWHWYWRLFYFYWRI